jgi:multidrug efflux pump subunit AcrA (membrane-fusion protein)
MARLLGIIVALGLSIPVTGPAWCAADGTAARAAIDQAERAVQAARERGALWTTAEDALAQARAALSREDYAAAVSAAERATGQAQLGLEQTGYPDFTWLIKESQ